MGFNTLYFKIVAKILLENSIFLIVFLFLGWSDTFCRGVYMFYINTEGVRRELERELYYILITINKEYILQTIKNYLVKCSIVLSIVIHRYNLTIIS